MKTTVNAAINAHKILVTPLVLLMMAYYDNWSATSFLYLGLHGTYTLLWLMKQSIYPDKRFEQVLPLHIAFFTPFLPLAGYSIATFLLISNHTVVPPVIFAIAPCIYTLGIFLHYVGDAQKYFILRERKQLIKDGLFARTRNPNYLGEILIYGAFALVSRHWIPLFILAAWVAYFFINMAKKDRSMARHEDFANYKQKTGKLFPKLF
jgi:protein-S-isoprenylcysteine O-methyltransferase Ste14